MFKVPNQYRVLKGPFASTDESGNNGAFLVPYAGKVFFSVIASDELGWEHVSAQMIDYGAKIKGKAFMSMPNWNQMCKLKELFWGDDCTVMQLHVPRSRWVNNHAMVLHLWRPVGVEIPQPNSIMVGIKTIDDKNEPEDVYRTILRGLIQQLKADNNYYGSWASALKTVFIDSITDMRKDKKPIIGKNISVLAEKAAEDFMVGLMNQD